MIQVRNLTKRYGEKLAIDNVSFDIEDGKIYGFLGPNGAGKSTTMNIITGCISATSGSVTVNGKDIFKDPIAAKRGIGYLPEIPPLYPDMTPAEYLTFVAEAKGVGAEETYRQVNEVMALTDIEHVSDRLIGNLSKGYRQRVGIAQALLGNPGLIILDEPTVGLDPKQIIEIRDLIRSLGKTKTVILSSHILAEISAVCDHIMIISEGHLVANDTPERLEDAMNSKSKIILAVKADKETACAVLEKVAGIREYTAEISSVDGCTHFEIQADDGVELREPIFFAFADNRLPIVKMDVEHLTLEDIFLKLTTVVSGEVVAEETEIEESEEESAQENEDVQEDYTPLFSFNKNTTEEEDN